LIASAATPATAATVSPMDDPRLTRATTVARALRPGQARASD
jgi:hypothetical protein